MNSGLAAPAAALTVAAAGTFAGFTGQLVGNVDGADFFLLLGFFNLFRPFGTGDGRVERRQGGRRGLESEAAKEGWGI